MFTQSIPDANALIDRTFRQMAICFCEFCRSLDDSFHIYPTFLVLFLWFAMFYDCIRDT